MDLKSLEGNISNFLRSVTGSDILTCSSIKVTFNTLEGLIRRPVIHTCGPMLELATTYQSYNELVDELSSILSDKSCLNKKLSTAFERFCSRSNAIMFRFHSRWPAHTLSTNSPHSCRHLAKDVPY